MEFFAAGINPPPSTPLCLSPILSPETSVAPMIPELDISEESKVIPDKIGIITFVGKKRDSFPPREDITTSWSVPREAVSTYAALVTAVKMLGVRRGSKFTILLPNGFQVHPSFWAPHSATEDLIYVRFSPAQIPGFSMPPPAYTLTPQRFIKLAINGLWADSYDQAPQKLSVVCKSGTHLTVADIHGQAVDAVKKIVTQCRYAVEPKGDTLVGFKMAVDGKGEISLEEETDAVLWDDGVELQCTAIWQ